LRAAAGYRRRSRPQCAAWIAPKLTLVAMTSRELERLVCCGKEASKLLA